MAKQPEAKEKQVKRRSSKASSAKSVQLAVHDGPEHDAQELPDAKKKQGLSTAAILLSKQQPPPEEDGDTPEDLDAVRIQWYLLCAPVMLAFLIFSLFFLIATTGSVLEAQTLAVAANVSNVTLGSLTADNSSLQDFEDTVTVAGNDAIGRTD